MNHHLLIGQKLQQLLDLAERARQNTDLLSNHFESKVPQRLTDHLAALLDHQQKIMAADGGESAGADYMTSIDADIRKVKHALTAYVPEAAGLVSGGAQ
ncbi:putative transcriptional regulator [Microvirga lupini]|uniref:Putative transcriptional regulator n=1 Tax=Microvirga lupini TaxID=420324 RepID=A0A7W4VJ23_9HYPH|nr:hypothetical protein [Microvirga lupini]MBB3017686.1 putative transcriptional regulator [Microvirga lupini]